VAGALVLAAAVVSGSGTSAGTAAAATGTARPTLTFADTTTQAELGTAYTKALSNLLDTNTVAYDPATYNSSGLMTTDPQTFIKAGGGYDQPWTRDAAVNSWNAASLLEPKQAANTLWSAVTKQADGQLIVQQDNETWDQVVWMTGAWNHYLVTGDQTNGTHVQLWDCNNTAAQSWTRQADGTIRADGNCLDVTSASTADGAPVEEWTCNGGANQQWTAVNGTLVNPASSKCLDDPGGNTANGTQLEIWTCNGGANQRWATP
jgi:hypothetical protein